MKYIRSRTEIIIDPVMDYFNQEKPYTDEKSDFNMDKLAQNGLSGMTVYGLFGLTDSEFGEVIRATDLQGIGEIAEPLIAIKQYLAKTRNQLAMNPDVMKGQGQMLEMLDYALKNWDDEQKRNKALEILEQTESVLINRGQLSGDENLEGFFKKVKKLAKKAISAPKNVIKQAVHAVNKINPLTLTARNALRVLFSLNFMGISSKLAEGVKPENEAPDKELWKKQNEVIGKIENMFSTMGGAKSKIRKSIEHGSKRPPLLGKKGQTVSASPENMDIEEAAKAENFEDLTVNVNDDGLEGITIREAVAISGGLLKELFDLMKRDGLFEIYSPKLKGFGRAQIREARKNQIVAYQSQNIPTKPALILPKHTNNQAVVRIPPYQAMAYLFEINLFNISAILVDGLKTKQQAVKENLNLDFWFRKNRVLVKLLQSYKNQGGNPTALASAIFRGANRKAIYNDGANPKDDDTYSLIPEKFANLNLGLGEAVTLTTSLATGGAFFKKAWSWLKDGGLLKTVEKGTKTIEKGAKFLEKNKETVKQVTKVVESFQKVLPIKPNANRQENQVIPIKPINPVIIPNKPINPVIISNNPQSTKSGTGKQNAQTSQEPVTLTTENYQANIEQSQVSQASSSSNSTVKVAGSFFSKHKKEIAIGAGLLAMGITYAVFRRRQRRALNGVSTKSKIHKKHEKPLGIVPLT
jgi:hypothetical protein